MLQLLLIAFGLAMDAFSVSVVSGICIPGLKKWQSLRAALFFGLFQFGMMVIGCFAGNLFSAYIDRWDHWIAFGLLAVIGGKMAIEAGHDLLRDKGACACEDESSCSGEAQKAEGIQSLGTLTVLAIATSIDALAVGLSMSLLGENILFNATIVGLVTFVLSLVGVRFGRKIGSRLGEWAEIAGGLVLVGIGVKILVEHLAG